MRLSWSRIVVLLVCVAFFSAFPLSADEAVLRYDDDGPDGKQSLGGSGHVMRFDPPTDDQWYVTQVDVCASQYGGGYDPQTTFCLAHICSIDMQALGEGKAPYSSWPTGAKQQWGSIEMPGVPVRGPFHVIASPGSLQYRGLFVAWDVSSADPNDLRSGSGAPGQPPKPPRQPLEWMIRVTLTDEPPEGGAAPAAPGEVLAWDDGTAEDKQSYGGSTGMITRFGPPEGGGLVDAIELYGGAYGTGQGADRTGFTLTICDEDMKVVGQSMYPYALFAGTMQWTRIDLRPDVPVSGPFYVIYQGRCAQKDGIFLGIDTSTGAGQCFLGTPEGISDWQYRLRQDSMNWMIRAELKSE